MRFLWAWSSDGPVHGNHALENLLQKCVRSSYLFHRNRHCNHSGTVPQELRPNAFHSTCQSRCAFHGLGAQMDQSTGTMCRRTFSRPFLVHDGASYRAVACTLRMLLRSGRQLRVAELAGWRGSELRRCWRRGWGRRREQLVGSLNQPITVPVAFSFPARYTVLVKRSVLQRLTGTFVGARCATSSALYRLVDGAPHQGLHELYRHLLQEELDDRR
jgi:hypothetical protein